MNAKLKTDALDLTSLLNGLVFFSPVSLLVRDVYKRQVLNLVTFVVTQLAMGVTVLIARYLGEKRPQYIGCGRCGFAGQKALTKVHRAVCGEVKALLRKCNNPL